MLKIGLTGGIGSGKTTVARIFRLLGVPVFDADDVAKNIMNENEELKIKLTKHFGAAAFINNKLNRKYLAETVFKNAEKLQLLNNLVHPLTMKAAAEWMLQQSSPYVIKEAALLFEAGSHKNLDYIIGVYAPQGLRIERVMKRQNITAEEVISRIQQQMNDEEKLRSCNFVIINDDAQLIIPQVIELHKKFLSA